MNKKPRSIRRKSLRSHLQTALLVALLFSIICGLYCVSAVRTYFLEQTVQQSQSLALREGIYGWRSSPKYAQLVENYQRLMGGTIFIVDDDDGSVTFSMVKIENADDAESPLMPEEAVFHTIEIEDELLLREAREVLEGNTVSSIRFFPFSERWVVYGATPVYDGDDVAYGLFVIKPLKNLRRIWERLTLSVTLGFTVSMLVAVFFSIRYARRMSEPILNLTQAADHILEGEGSPMLVHTGNDEITRLYEAFTELDHRVDNAVNSMRLERDRLNAIIDGINDGILAVDRNGAIVHYNIAFLEMLEMPTIEQCKAEFKTNETVRKLYDCIEKALMTGEDGGVYWKTATGRAILARVSPVLTMDHRVGVICLLTDVSEADRVEQMRRDYIGNISHELRTPLTGIRGLVEPLMDGVVETDEERMEYYRIIDQEARRLESLVGEMLDLSRLQSDGASIDLEDVHLEQAIDTALASMRVAAETAGIRLEADLSGDRTIVLGDEARIVQVLVILLDNAIDFTPSGGRVAVSVRDEGTTPSSP